MQISINVREVAFIIEALKSKVVKFNEFAQETEGEKHNYWLKLADEHQKIIDNLKSQNN